MVRVLVGMSVLSVRSATMQNLNYLFEFSKLNANFKVQIFNKSGSALGNFPNTLNFNIQPVVYEDLYETMARLDLKEFSHVVWLNDDDIFTLPSDVDLTYLEYDSVAYPTMSIRTSTKELKIDWQPIFHSKSETEAFKNYWRTASPLFFCILPVRLFRIWIDYVKKMEIHLPHLDTQMNILAALQKNRKMLPNFTYAYGAENWETPEKLEASSIGFSRAFNKSDDFIYCMELIRNIDNVCILSAYSTAFKVSIPESLLRVVLLQFSPLQNGRASRVIFKSIVRNLLPVYLRRQILLFMMVDRNRKGFYLRLPIELLDFFLGSRILKTPNDLLEELSRENIAEFLMVPDSMLAIWRQYLTSLNAEIF